MVYPSLYIKEVLHHFYCRWNDGLQPRLSLNTLPDGSIAISSEVISSMSSNYVHLPSNSSHAHMKFQGHRRRSGLNARSRRRNMRRRCQFNSTDIIDNPFRETAQIVPDPEIVKIELTGCSESTPKDEIDCEIRPLTDCSSAVDNRTFNDSEIEDVNLVQKNSELAAQIEVLNLAI